jgi:hypothetical protein
VCDNTQAETASHILCDSDDSAEIRPHCFGKHFMEPSGLDKIALCKILNFVGGMGLLRGMETIRRLEDGRGTTDAVRAHATPTNNKNCSVELKVESFVFKFGCTYSLNYTCTISSSINYFRPLIYII